MPFLDRSPLEYPVNTASSIRRWEDTRPPTSADFKQFHVGDHWLDSTARIWWILAFKDSTQGLWRMLGTTSGGLTNLTPDAGGMVSPDIANNINILGSAGIVTTGNPGLNTITIGTSGGSPIPQYLQGNAGGPITPDGTSIIYVVGTATNGINIVGNGATFTLTASLSGLYTDGDFIFRNDVAATPRVITISNSNANALSSANLTIAVPDASFDPFTLYQVNATQTYSFGIDNSDSDKLKLTDGINPSNGTEILSIDPTSANAITINNAYTLPTADGAITQVLTTDGSGAVSWQNPPATSKMVQYVYARTTAYVKCTTVIPLDDTIPQNTEGNEVITLTITPTDVNNLLIIKFTGSGEVEQPNNVPIIALFQDAGVHALAAALAGSTTIIALYSNYILTHTMLAGTVIATTFKVRAGPNIPGFVAINGGLSRNFGGVASTVLEIWEVTP
jgi:hypothetical protein